MVVTRVVIQWRGSLVVDRKDGHVEAKEGAGAEAKGG